MAVRFIKSKPNKENEYTGLSSDPKPTDCGANSTFVEYDSVTKQITATYIYDGVDWLKC